MKQLRGGQFAWSAGWRLGLFALYSLGSPFVFAGAVAVSKCADLAAGCSALAWYAALYLPPLMVLAFLGLMIGPPMARMRALGLPAFSGLVVVSLLAMDFRYLWLLAGYGASAFTMATGLFNFPGFLVLALVLTVALALVREPRSSEDGLWQRHGRLGKAILGSVAFVTGAALLLSVMFWFSGVGVRASMILLSLLVVMEVLAAVAAVAVIVFVIFDRLAKPSDPGSAQTNTATVSPDDPGPSSVPPTSRPLPGRSGPFGRRGLPSQS
jgi:hypothetical protein